MHPSRSLKTLSSQSDIKAFFAINDPSALGAAPRLKLQASLVSTCTASMLPRWQSCSSDGTFTLLRSGPIEIAKTAFQKAIDLLEGKEIEAEIFLPSH